MRNELLGVFILGFFVVLFWSIYRQRPSRRLRLWVAGWTLVLLHFVFNVARPHSPLPGHIFLSLSVNALVLAGLCFLLSPMPIAENPRIASAVVLLMGLPALVYPNSLIFGFGSRPLLFAAAAACAVGGMAIAWMLYRPRPRLFFFLIAALAACEVWVLLALAFHQDLQGNYVILAEIVFTFATLYWFEFRRFSAGVLTTMTGLMAWALAFPLALACRHLFPAVNVTPELWSIPNYLVAFGMLLALLEDEIHAAARAGEHYRLLFFSNPHPMWIHDAGTLRFLKVNDAAVKHYGYSREEFHAMTVHDLRPSEDLEAILKEKSKSNSFTLTGPWQHRKKDGSAIQVDIAAHLISYRGRACWFVLVQDVTERQRMHRQLLHQAHHDSLTGLPNRIMLEDRMRQTFAHAARTGRRAAVICIDLDRFKRVNDTFGHAAGDLCLRQVADRISRRLRAVDTAARAGGEEFVTVLGDLNGAGDAEVVARDLVEVIAEPIEADGQLFHVGASMGIAMYPDDGIGAAELWRAADGAMYRAKQAGGSRYLFVTPEADVSISESSELERYMRHMLKLGGFEIRYQPIYSIAGSLCGLEALLRLEHPQFGLVPPSQFIPLAEECGLIAELGRWAIAEICRQGARWRRQGLKPIRIFANASSFQFLRREFSAEVKQAFDATGMDPLLLGLEITESALMSNLPETTRQMQELAALGVHFAIDDFGSGFSSIGQLHRLPISTLKIDRSFTEQINSIHGTHSVVRAAIAMGHSLGLQMLAKGVENAGQLDSLRRLGCDSLQGELLSAPLAAARVPRFLLQPSPAFAKPVRSLQRVGT